MKNLLTIILGVCILFSCSDNAENERLKENNKLLKSEIQTLKDSIESIGHPKFEFDIAEPIAISNYSKDEKSIRILAGHYAYNSEDPQLIKYWIDDSTISDKKMIEYQGSTAIEFDFTTLPEHSQKAMEKGKHNVYGMTRLKIDGEYQWGHWVCDYEIE